jgi:hypothetical protein
MPVDRHHRAPDRACGAGQLEQRKVVAQHHGDRLAAAQAELTQSRCRPGDAGVNFRIADAAFAADDRCQFAVLGRLESRLR